MKNLSNKDLLEMLDVEGACEEAMDRVGTWDAREALIVAEANDIWWLISRVDGKRYNLPSQEDFANFVNPFLRRFIEAKAHYRSVEGPAQYKNKTKDAMRRAKREYYAAMSFAIFKPNAMRKLLAPPQHSATVTSVTIEMQDNIPF